MICGICSREENNRIHIAREHMFGLDGEFEYLECGSCGCLQIVHPPSDLERYYPDDYYAQEDLGPWWKRWMHRKRASYALLNTGILGRSLLKRFPNQALAALRRLDPRLRLDESILDVGCGAGRLLQAIGDAGFRNVLGIDPFNKMDLVHPNGVHIRKARLEDLDGTWDLIMFNHSFEHEFHPFEALKQVHRLLAPEGRCLIRVPVAASWAWEHYRTDWVQLDAPRHMFLHSSRSMSIVAAEANLMISEITYESSGFQFWGSEQIREGISLFRDPRSYAVNPHRSIFSRTTIEEFDRKAHTLNADGQGDQASFVLKHSR